MPQHPERAQKKCPERKTLTHECKPLGIWHPSGALRRRLVNSINRHRHYPPNDPLVEGISFLTRGSIATAVRRTRARPLKQDSAMWWSFVPCSVSTCRVTPAFIAKA